MPEVHSAQVGRFCWFELSTTDQTAAKLFYSRLFGWTCEDMPIGPDAAYTFFRINGRDVGACCTLQPEQLQHGVPPNWLTYVAVSNVDESVAKAQSLGGTVIVPGCDVFDSGRLAVLQDPTGAVIAMWQAKVHHGVGILNDLNTFGWCELLTNDTAAATKFYTGLFGWDTMVSDAAGFSYTHWRQGGVDFGGMMAIQPQMGPIPPHWMNYLAVADCDACVAQCESLGGRVCCPPMDIPNVGRFATLMDPQGAAFSVIKLVPMAK
jgi:hypothetical protein